MDHRDASHVCIAGGQRAGRKRSDSWVEVLVSGCFLEEAGLGLEEQEEQDGLGIWGRDVKQL